MMYFVAQNNDLQRQARWHPVGALENGYEHALANVRAPDGYCLQGAYRLKGNQFNRPAQYKTLNLSI